MKYLLCILTVFALLAGSKAMAIETMDLTDEEVRLVKAFRKDPALFRQVLNAGKRGSSVGGGQDISGLIGPRDIIDVSIVGGRVQFYGKNHEFEPVSFRVARGEAKTVIFRKKGAVAETRVLVAYRSDGLHFDVPESFADTDSAENGLLIIPEDGAWNDGTVVTSEGRLGSRGSSRGENLQLKIRYALLSGRNR